MVQYLRFWLICIGLIGLSTALSAHEVNSNFDTVKSKKLAQQDEEPLPPIVIRVTGYGAFEKAEDAASESKKLLALRASKLDAFRALAERVYGTTVTGNSTVQDFVLKHDGFATVVDTVVRGARVVSVMENKGAGFETVLELLLPGNFQDCVTKVNSFRTGSDCLRPLPQFNAFQAQPGQSRNPSAANNMDRIYFLK